MKDMNEIIIPKTTISDEQYAYNARQLYMAVVHKALEDYCKTTSESARETILKQLRSDRLSSLTDGVSEVAANQLEVDFAAIAERLKIKDEEE